ncbi:hypothetical protein B566_EDAN017728 [Ephemera danica]|nr:hypothetical protein B566_EDAN017728 [Ephemera danica]
MSGPSGHRPGHSVQLDLIPKQQLPKLLEKLRLRIRSPSQAAVLLKAHDMVEENEQLQAEMLEKISTLETHNRVISTQLEQVRDQRDRILLSMQERQQEYDSLREQHEHLMEKHEHLMEQHEHMMEQHEHMKEKLGRLVEENK